MRRHRRRELLSSPRTPLLSPSPLSLSPVGWRVDDQGAHVPVEALVGDVTIPLAERDVFVAPSWKPLRLRASSDLVLFGFSDRAAQDKLNLYREHLG